MHDDHTERSLVGEMVEISSSLTSDLEFGLLWSVLACMWIRSGVVCLKYAFLVHGLTQDTS